MTGYTVPAGYWTDADDHDSDAWCYAHMTGATSLPYWQWVAQQRATLHARQDRPA